jgi:hypothetical protein
MPLFHESDLFVLLDKTLILSDYSGEPWGGAAMQAM